MCSGEDSLLLSDLTRIAERLRARGRVPARSDDEVADELKTLRHAIDLLEVSFAVLADQLAGTETYGTSNLDGPLFWIRTQCHMSGINAVRALQVGQHLDALPQSAAALDDGRIGFGHLALMGSTVDAVRGADTERAFDETPLLRLAERHTVSRFRNDCAQVRHAADDERFRREHVEATLERVLELMPHEDGSLSFKGWVDAVGAAAVQAALDPLARRNGAEERRQRSRRYADALVELAQHALDSGDLPVSGGVRPHILVTASVETLQGLRGTPGGELEGGAVVPKSTVQRLACDATIRRVLLDADGAVLEVGRARRVASTALVAALRVRDGGCVWPRCNRKASYTTAHHVVHWANGGTTDLSNLLLLCHRHHWMVHEGGWQLARAEDDTITAVRPPMSMWPAWPGGGLPAPAA